MHTKHAVVLWQLSLRACTAHLLVRTAGYLHETAPNVLGPGKMLFGGPLAGNSLQRQPPSRPGRQHHDNSIGGDHDDGNGDRDDAVDALLKRPVIAQITPDGSSCSSASAELIRSVSRAVAGGVSLVQLRDYQGNTESKADLARRICQVTAGSSAWFVVNLNDGDCSWVRDCGADGVHLPEREIGLLAGLRHSNAQSAWPTVVGCSVHSVGAALAAAKLGADYVQVGTMFATQSHPGKEPEGVSLLAEVRQCLNAEGLGAVLVIGVGGVDGRNCGKVMAAGGDGVAAIRCLCDSDGAEREARHMLKAMTDSAADASRRSNSPAVR